MLTALRVLAWVALLAVVAVGALWGIRLAGYGYLLAARRRRSSRSAPTSPSRR